MEENQTPPIGEFNSRDVTKDISSLKNSEAFAQMADDITLEDLAPQTKTEPRTVNVAQQQKPKENLMSGLNGPKYMEALDSILAIADIRAIETELPILKTKVEVSPLTSQEEQALKTASVSPESFLKKIDELLFSHTKFSEGNFASYHDFLANLYPPDKSILIWALMSSTYMVLPTVEKECESCGKKYLVDANPKDLIHSDTINKAWDKELPPSEFTEGQGVMNDYIHFEFGMPSERDRLIITKLINPEKAKDNLEKTGGLLSYVDNLVFFTKAVVVGDDKERIVLTDPIQDIYPFLKNMPPKISDAIKSQVNLTMFDEYMPHFYLIGNCSHCNAQENIDVDPEISFFRKAISF